MAGVGGIVGALAVTSLSFACTVPTGNTWYTDGSFSKSGPSGTVITVFGSNARRNKPFLLVAGTNASHPDHACMDAPDPINPNTRWSTVTNGFIGNTSGPVNRPQGTWQICFMQTGPTPSEYQATATNPVFFTVI